MGHEIDAFGVSEFAAVSKVWHSFRRAVLILTFGASAFVFGKIVTQPPLGDPLAVSVELPENIPIPSWQQGKAMNLDDRADNKDKYIEGLSYQYVQGSAVLDVQARYFDGTNGDVRKFINSYVLATKAQRLSTDDLELRTLDGIGDYWLISDQDSLQLSSCINPYGKTTVLVRDYKRNRNFQDIRYRLIPWLLGGRLKDERCLWTHMSIDQSTKTIAEADILLEEAWIAWYAWWSKRFPKK